MAQRCLHGRFQYARVDGPLSMCVAQNMEPECVVSLADLQTCGGVADQRVPCSTSPDEVIAHTSRAEVPDTALITSVVPLNSRRQRVPS